MKKGKTNRRLLMTVLLGLLTLVVQAQVTLVDDHYVDPKQGLEANPTNNPDWSLMQDATVKKAAKAVKGRRNAPIAPAVNYGLPDHVNNGANKYFRSPVANQAGNSCGITSRHSHMMAYELNAYRDKDGSLAENKLPAHFAFVPAYKEDPNKENYAKYIGVPDGVTFGGTNVSSIYGGPYSENSNNYGRMQGYENWHKAMFNRITDNPNFPTYTLTEAGALAWKRWLYNHNGDESFHAGGVIGIGCASSGLDYQAIGSTTANDAAGVTGLNYLTHWGTGVDHAMAVVGYDDRVEFDLDGNGTYGQTSNAFGQNETGAWIVANSWGSGWGNNGFLYVPYALASPTSTTVTSGSYSGYKAGDNTGWNGEIYKIRKAYTPIRTLKAAVAYSKRSEIQISVGISKNLNASSPDKTMVLKNHSYHGDYDGDGTDAEVPMLGRWTDGKLHTEAMEFGYDLTDFTDEFDRHVPLKYFLIINTKSGASGSGKIEYASIMDYELNPNGIETPFASKNVNITNNGGTTTISTVVYGEEVCGPDNLTLNSTTLSWDAPQTSGYTPTGYYIYQDGERIGSSNTTSYDIGSATGIFYVTAGLYEVDGAIAESPASNFVLRNMSSSSFISYIKDPISTTSELTSNMYVMLYNNGRGKYMYDNGASTIYLFTSRAPKVLDPDDYKYVFKVTKSSNRYTFTSINGKIPAISSNNQTLTPSISAGSYTVAKVSGSDNLFTLYSNTYLNGTDNNPVGWSSGTDATSKWIIMPVNVSIPTSNTLSVNIAEPENVYVGTPVQLHVEGAADIASATWTVDGTNYTGVSPFVTFNSTGTKTVSCTATDSKGNSQTTSKTITVSSAPTVTANFTLSSESTTGSDRISFLSANTVPGCTYSWSMPGAEETTATTRNASATYLSTGEKTVTLTVTDANNNSYSHTETFMVNASAPKTRYTISPTVVVKNNTVTLTDNSRYDPTSWNWRFESDNNRITCTTQNGTITPTKAGVYKLTFLTENALGYDYVETERALIVCNSASYTGLTFAGGNQNVTASLSTALTTAWTLDFWFNPKSLGSTTQGITGSKNSNSFTITSDASGVATLTVGSQSVTSDKAFYISNEWHHYAITFSSGTVTFYRDGSVVSTKSISTTNFSSYFQNLKLGGSAAPMNGSIDEFRVWSIALTQANIRSYCVAPINATTSGLKLYWQMNQSTGNVTDATSNGTTGTRNNFGPDGDAWTDSEGVFALDFSDVSVPAVSGTQLSHAYDNIYNLSDEQDGALQRASLGLAFDGNTSTYYQSRWESGQYMNVADYPHSFVLRRGALHEITAFDIYSNTTPTNWSSAPPSASYGRAALVTIEESDDADEWYMVDKNVRLYDIATNNVVLPTPVTKEYVRFTFSEPLYDDGNYCALVINEMNFYGTAAAGPVKTKVPLTFVECSDYDERENRPGSLAFDDNTSTFWQSSWYGGATAYPHTFTVENTNLSDIDMFYIYQKHSNASNQKGSFRGGVLMVETSSDNSTWATAYAGRRIPYGGEGYVLLPEPVNSRYLRLSFLRDEVTTGTNGGTNQVVNVIQAYSVDKSVPVTITWNLLDPAGTTRYTVDKTCTAGTTISSYPDELTAYEEQYITLPTLTPFTATSSITKNVTCSYSLPFQISDESQVNYYYLRFLRAASRNYTYCMSQYLSASDLSGGAMQMLQNNTVPANNSGTYKLQWAFYGNPFDGFTIKNRSVAGSVYSSSSQLLNGGIPEMSESNATVWSVKLGKYIAEGDDTYKTDQIRTAMAGGTMCIAKDGWYFTNYGYNDALKLSNSGQANWLTQIIPTLAESVNMSKTITWRVMNGETVLYEVEKTYTTGSTVSSYPDELTTWATGYADRFVALPELTSFTVAEDETKEVPYSWTGPFQLTTDTDNPNLYYFKSARYGYYAYAPSASNGQTKQASQTKNVVTPRGRWFFTGDPFNGIEIRPFAHPETGLVNNTLSTTPTKYIPKSAPDITTNYWSNALPSAAISFVLPNNPSNCLAEQLGTWSSASINSDKGLSFVVEDAEDISMLVYPGYYQVRCMGPGLTTKYWKLDSSDHKLYNNGDPTNANTVFRIEENVNADNNLPASWYIAGFDGDDAWYLDNARTSYSQQFTTTQTADDYVPAQIEYNAKSGDIPYYAIKLSTQSSYSGYSYANTNNNGTTVVTWAYTDGTADGSAWAIEPVARIKFNPVGDKSYATFYYDRDVQTNANTTAYYITTASDGYAQLTEVDNDGHDIPARTAVVLVNSDKDDYAILPVTSGLSSVVDAETNLLKGTLVPMSLDLSDSSNNYSLGKKNNKIGFYKYSSGTITLGANKAYLETTAAPSVGVKGFVFDLDDDPDAIVSPLEETEEGAAIYKQGSTIVNLSGQRLNKPRRGMNIINGKIIIIN